MEQGSLHTNEYKAQREVVMRRLASKPLGTMRFDGNDRSRIDMLCEVVLDSELGQKLVFQSTIDTRVQL